MTTFARVQEILNNALANWQTRHHRLPDIAKHNAAFGWDTRAQLLGSTAFGLPLIAQEHITNGTGEQSNLVIALRTGVAPRPRMPIGGPFIGDPEILEIVDWINTGAN